MSHILNISRSVSEDPTRAVFSTSIRSVSEDQTKTTESLERLWRPRYETDAGPHLSTWRHLIAIETFRSLANSDSLLNDLDALHAEFGRGLVGVGIRNFAFHADLLAVGIFIHRTGFHERYAAAIAIFLIHGSVAQA